MYSFLAIALLGKLSICSHMGITAFPIASSPVCEHGLQMLIQAALGWGVLLVSPSLVTDNRLKCGEQFQLRECRKQYCQSHSYYRVNACLSLKSKL